MLELYLTPHTIFCSSGIHHLTANTLIRPDDRFVAASPCSEAHPLSALSDLLCLIIEFSFLHLSPQLFIFASSIAVINAATFTSSYTYAWIASVSQRWVQTRPLAGQPFILTIRDWYDNTTEARRRATGPRSRRIRHTTLCYPLSYSQAPGCTRHERPFAYALE